MDQFLVNDTSKWPWVFTCIYWYINIWYLQMKMNVRGTLAWMEPLVTILWDHSLVSVLMDSWAICAIMVKFTLFLIRIMIENNRTVNYWLSLIKQRNSLGRFSCLGVRQILNTVVTVIKCSFIQTPMNVCSFQEYVEMGAPASTLRGLTSVTVPQDGGARTVE